MSSMLEQAIIDAEQLKETAQRTAEEAVIEKYQSEIKEAVSQILEQEDSMAETALVIDEDGAELVEDLPPAHMTEEDEIVEINLDKLEEMMAQEIEEGTLDATEMLEREEVLEELGDLDEEVEIDEDINDLLEEEDLDEDIEINEEDITSVIAELLSEEEESLEEIEIVEEVEDLEEKQASTEKYDDDPALEGDQDKLPDPLQKAIIDKAGEKSKKLQKENKTLIKEQTRMSSKVQLLEEKLDKYGTVISQLKEKLDESNLTNAKLLYQNRILNSISLNERQKDKIVEAISNASSVEEAKIIFETLQSAVGLQSKKDTKQESLNEVVSRSSSTFIPRKEVKPSTSVFSDRMKRLAGLK